MELTLAQLCGVSDTHVRSVPGESSPLIQLQPQVSAAFTRMQSAAAQAGVHLHIASGFRSFERQAGIWARKYTGIQTPVRDESLHAILRWSALPGLSRHHWGTDFDCYDPVALGEQSLQLEPREYGPEGPMAALFAWLTAHAHEFGFYRPYLSNDTPGVAAEPWHWSYAPLAAQYQARYQAPVPIVRALDQFYQEFEVVGREHITAQFASLIERYMGSVAAIPDAALQPVQGGR